MSVRAHSRTTLFFWGFAIAAGLGIVGAIGSGVDLPEALGIAETSSADASIMVVIVGDTAAVDRMREAFGTDRLRVDTPHGFATDSGRVIAATHDVTGPILARAGWGDAALDIYLPGSLHQPSARSRGHVASGGPSPRIRELMDKPRLSLMESRELLGWMDQQ